MRSVLCSRVVRLAILLIVVGGCSRGPDRGSAPKRSAAVNTQKLPELGDYLPPLDNDRLELAPPAGWYVPSASSKYVVRVQKSNRETYPSVTVTAQVASDSRAAKWHVAREHTKEIARALLPDWAKTRLRHMRQRPAPAPFNPTPVTPEIIKGSDGEISRAAGRVTWR